MSCQGWRGTVVINGQKYTGEGRRFMEGAMYSATRAALKALGKPFGIHLSNRMVQDSLDQLCQDQNWDAPEYSAEPIVHVPEQSMKIQKPLQESQTISAILKIGKHCFIGDATFGAVHAEANAARKALKQYGQLCHIGGSEEVIRDLYDFCHRQGLGEPSFTFRFGSNVPDKVPIAPAHEQQFVRGNDRQHTRGLWAYNGGYRGRRGRVNCCREELPQNGTGFCRSEERESFALSYHYDRRVVQGVANAPRCDRRAERNINANAHTRMRVQHRLPAMAWN